jgi:RNA-binding protein
MQSLNTSQRQYLRRLAHDLRPTAQVGRQGVTPQLIGNVDEQLRAHELLKVKFVDRQDERAALAEQLARELSAALVALIGNVAVLYRSNPDREKQKVILPRA